jgi:type IV secretion system protein TrbI
MSDSAQQRRMEMRLRPERPRVTRLSRPMLMGAAAAVAIVLSGGLIWSLSQNGAESKNADEVYSTDNKQTPDGLAALPHDYSDYKVVAPPGRSLPPNSTAAAERGLPAAGAPEAGDDPLARESEAARTSDVFFSATKASEVSGLPFSAPAAPQPSPGAAPTAPSTPALPDLAWANGQSQKLGFVNAVGGSPTLSEYRLERPASRYVLQAGAVIPAALITGIRSDLPGQVTAQVTERVYDSPTGRHLLIPQGSRLIGVYNSEVTLGQNRVQLVWTRLILPNGQSIVLERQTGADTQGFAGLEDDVDQHWGQLLMSAALSTALSIGSQAGATNNDSAIAQAIRQGASGSTSQIGQQLVSRNQNIQPTLTIRPGFPLNVIVDRDLVLMPYPTAVGRT